MIPGETLGNDAASTCPDCGVKLVPKVLRSAAGHYIGTACNCGPYSRESGYYPSLQYAEESSYFDDDYETTCDCDLCNTPEDFIYEEEAYDELD